MTVLMQQEEPRMYTTADSDSHQSPVGSVLVKHSVAMKSGSDESEDQLLILEKPDRFGGCPGTVDGDRDQ